MKLKNGTALLLVVIVLVVSAYGYSVYKKKSDNTSFPEREIYVYIPTEATYKNVAEILAPYFQDLDRFQMTAEKKLYSKRKIRTISPQKRNEQQRTCKRFKTEHSSKNSV